MANIDFRIARSMSQLKSEQMAPFVEYLKADRADTLEQMAKAIDPSVIYRMQGKAEFLRQLLEDIVHSDALAAKLRK